MLDCYFAVVPSIKYYLHAVRFIGVYLIRIENIYLKCSLCCVGNPFPQAPFICTTWYILSRKDVVRSTRTPFSPRLGGDESVDGVNYKLQYVTRFPTSAFLASPGETREVKVNYKQSLSTLYTTNGVWLLKWITQIT